MQQRQPQRRFSDAPSQQPVYRFPQNQAAQGYQPQQHYYAQENDTPVLSAKEQRALSRAHRKHKKRRSPLLWNLFAIIGIVTVITQAVRYLIIPLLVYLNVISGGTL